MNPRLKALHERLQALINEADALGAKAELTADETARATALPDEIAATKRDIEGVIALERSRADAAGFLNGAGVAAAAGAGVPAAVPAATAPDLQGARQLASAHGIRVADPSSVRTLARGRAKYLAAVPGMSREQANESAHRFAMWFLATTRGGRSPKAVRFCAENGIPVYSAGHVEGIDEDGGYLVPPEFEGALIDLKELYGVFRQHARVSPMRSDTKSRPRRKGGLTAYFVGEGAAATESKAKWDLVTLVAKKLMINTKMSSELDEDNFVDLGDRLMYEIAYAFAKKEDECGFVGDGTSTYGGITGVTQRLLDTYSVAGGLGLVLGNGNLWSEITLEDHTKVLGALPHYADTPQTSWFCHKTYFATVMLQLMLESGGVTAAEVASGAVYRNPTFLGYPVVFAQAMPRAQANSQVPAILGDLSLAADYGERRATSIAMSEHAHFESDELALRGTERFDINVHSVGDATEPGPVVGLLTAAA